MLTDQTRSPEESDRSWHEKARRSFRKRWVQVLSVFLAGLLVAGVAWKFLAPKRTSFRKVDTKTSQYMHCDKCGYETRFIPDYLDITCMQCPEDPPGHFIPTDVSLKASGGDSDKPSPWKWFVLVVSLDGLAVLGGIVYLLSLPTPDPAATFYVFGCPHCGQRLRFRKVALGGLGQCSRCKRPVRFPNADQAVLESTLLKEEERRRAELEAEERDDDEDDE